MPYSSKLDDPNSIDVNELNRNFKPTMASPQPKPTAYPHIEPLPITNSNVLSLIDKKYEAQEVMMYANYHRRMANAGSRLDENGMPIPNSGDPVLEAYAIANLQNDTQDLRLWQTTLKGKMEQIASLETFTPEEKDGLTRKVLNKTNDAIHIPETSEKTLSPYQQYTQQQTIKEDMERDFNIYSSIVEGYSEYVKAPMKGKNKIVRLARLGENGKPEREATPLETVQYSNAKKRLAENPIYQQYLKSLPTAGKAEGKPASPAGKREMTVLERNEILKEAGGDKKKAVSIAKARGFKTEGYVPK